MAHYRIWDKDLEAATAGLFLSREEAENALLVVRACGLDTDNFEIITVEEGHKRHWTEERRLRKLRKLLNN